MTVKLTSPVEGKMPNDSYTGSREAWLLAEGYATRSGYEGPGVSNTGPAGVKDPKKDPTLAKNREANKDSVVATGSALPAGGTNDGVEKEKVGEPDAGTAKPAQSEPKDHPRSPEYVAPEPEEQNPQA